MGKPVSVVVASRIVLALVEVDRLALVDNGLAAVLDSEQVVVAGNRLAVVVLGDDFTVRGGSADATIREKPIMAERMANELRLPIIRMIEGSGGGGSVKTIETTGRANLPGGVGGTQLYHLTAQNLGLVPVVALGLGSVAGLGAARLAAAF